MPISKYNPDGTVDIYNTKTGEVRNGIYPEELSTISPSLVAEYQKGQSPESQLGRKQAEVELAKLESPEEEELKDPFASQKQSALQSLQLLKKRYGREDTSTIGKEGDLSLAEEGGILSRTKAKTKAIGSKVVIGQLEQDINKYKNILDTFRGTFTQAFGSGTPQEAEAQALIEAAPSETSTNEEAQAWFDDVESLLRGTALKEETPDLREPQEIATFKHAPDLTGIATITPLEGKKKEGDGINLQDIAGKVAKAAPVAGGIAGGVSGGLIGNIPGSAIGTTIGTAAGGAVQNMIEDLAGIQDEKAEEQLKNVSLQAAVAGATDLAMSGVFKLVSVAGKPVLKAIAKGIDDIPLKGFRVNPSQLTKFAKHGEDMSEFVIKNNILGENAYDIAAAKAGVLQNTFDNLALSENITIPIDDLNQRFIQEIADLAPGEKKLVPSAFKGIAKNVVKEWDSIIKQMKRQGITELDPKMLTELRRRTDELIPDSAFAGKNVKNVYLRLRKIYNNVIQDAVDKTMLAPEIGGAIDDAGLKQLGLELSKYYDFLEIVEKQSNLGRGSRLLNLPRLLSGGFGATIGAGVGGPVGAGVGAAVGGVALEALSKDPNMLKFLYKLGKFGTKAAPTVGKALSVSKVIPPLVGAGAGQLVE